MHDPHLAHVEREAAARGRAPGWRVAAPRGPARLFADSEHGSAGAALDAALAWRDLQLDPRQHVPVPDAPVTLAPSLYFAAYAAKGYTYPVIKTSATDADGNAHTLARSLLKHAPEDAIRDAAEFRFRFRRGLPGFEHNTAEALYADALDAYRAYVAQALPS